MFRLFTFPLLLAAVVAGGGNDLLASVINSGLGSVPGIITMVLGLCLLITIHELGHWLVARLFGFQTPVFSIGFGKREWSLVLGTFWETEFRIAPILAGGYVSIPELMDESTLNEIAKENGEAPKAYRTFPVWQRIAVAAAGVTFNVISALMMVFALFAIWGQPDYKVNSTYIRDLSTTVTVASGAGLQPKDEFVSVGGARIVSPDDLSNALKSNKGKPVEVVVKRGAGQVNVTLTPTADGTIGISLGANADRIYQPMSVAAASKSVTVTGNTLVMTVKGIGMMVGLVPKPANVSDKDMEIRGIVGIVQMGAGALNTGVFDFVWFLVVISLNLAVMNILPIPMLDGGHIIFFLWEGITGKPVNAQAKARLSNIFVFLLLSLFLLGLFNDLRHIAGG